MYTNTTQFWLILVTFISVFYYVFMTVLVTTFLIKGSKMFGKVSKYLDNKEVK